MTNFLKNALMIVFVAMQMVAFAQTDIRLAMQTDKWAEVVSFYENATDGPNLLRLSSAYQALGQMDKAKAALTRAAADPKGKLLPVIEVRQALMSGDAVAVEKLVKKAEKAARGKDSELLRYLGESFMYGEKKNLPEAEKWLKESYTAKPKDYETLMQLGYLYKSMTNRLGDAVTNYEIASNLNGTDPLPYYMTAKAYWTGRNPTKYEEYLKKALAAEPNYVPALRDLADLQYFGRKYGLAKDTYKQCIDAQGANPSVEDEMQLGNCLFILKDYDGTVEQVNKIIGKDGSKNYLRRLLGYTYFEKGETDKAQDVMNDYFSKVAPDKIIAKDYEYMGKIQAAKKQDSIALVNLNKAVKMDSTLWNVYSIIGKIKFAQKDYPAAADAYQIRLDSLGEEATSTDFYSVGLANYYSISADPSRLAVAQKYFTKVTERSPQAGIGWLWLGKTLAKTDPDIEADSTKVAEFGKAQASFEKYIEVAKAEPEKNKKDLIAAYEYLSYVFISKGDKVGGCEKLNAILTLDPTNANALEYKTATGCQ